MVADFTQTKVAFQIAINRFNPDFRIQPLQGAGRCGRLGQPQVFFAKKHAAGEVRDFHAVEIYDQYVSCAQQCQVLQDFIPQCACARNQYLGLRYLFLVPGRNQPLPRIAVFEGFEFKLFDGGPDRILSSFAGR